MNEPDLRQTTRHAIADLPPLRLADEMSFLTHPWVAKLRARYEADALLAGFAMHQITTELNSINNHYAAHKYRSFFTSIEGRVKSEASFFRKLYGLCKERSAETGVIPQVLEQCYHDIKDLCGVRFACPYYDEIVPAISNVRDHLQELGYATRLQLADRNYLDIGDERGYRSYHFYVNVPTITSIYGDSTLCLCEIQVRANFSTFGPSNLTTYYTSRTKDGWLPTPMSSRI